MKRATTVMNVITEDRDTYFNDISLKENLITSIILETNGYSKMTFDKELREKVSKDIEMIPSKNGTMKAYSQRYDLIAYES
tara:strand:- start:69 stop:311 length:243 start_codon:yes stop_codon:yes gene_type:complete